MYRDCRFGLVFAAGLAACLPFAVHAQAPDAAPPGHQPPQAVATPVSVKAPPALGDVTGAIPAQEATPLQDDSSLPPKLVLPSDMPLPAAAAPAAPAPKTSQPNGTAIAPPAPPPKPLTGFAVDVKKALDSWPVPQGKGRQVAELWLEHKDIAEYYAARDYAPLWVADGKPVAAVAPIKARLALAGDDALNLADIPQADFSGDDDHLAAAEIAFSEEIVAYGRQASGSRIDPQDINPLIGAKPEVAEPGLILGAVAAAETNGDSVLQSFNPQQKPYLALRAKLIALRQRSAPVSQQAIPPGPSLKLGMTDPRVPLIRARLGLDVTQSDSDLIYDTQVATAIADFQKANGLRPSGVFTPRTQESLSPQPKENIENDIIANMETWRWMPRDLGQSRIDVNIPDYEVRVVLNGNLVLENKVVVGKPDTPTPIFSNTMKFLIVNPYWNVPPSILRKEMLPHLARDPYYLQRMGFETFYFHGRLMVRQPPGERNALGRIKFMFPNQYSVYLHDTPQRRLFAQTKRAFSHGCVRVDQPFDFAQTLLGPKWPEDRIKSLIGGKEHYVFLPRPLPIHIEYFTAYVGDDGRLILRDDVYGYEHQIEKALGLVG
ncbi:MAG: L,D-transpeptidase family protein [Pseudomonadota bacterium]